MKDIRPSSRKRLLTRREFLALTGMGAGALALSSCGILPATTRKPLPVAPTAPPTGRIKEYTFEAAPMQFQVPGKTVSTWGYNGVVPGPEIRVTEGDTVRVTVNNRLPDDTTIHWHGLPIPNNMDGVPDVTQPPIKPGQSFTYEFTAPLPGTYMYHTHVGLQLDRGLYGPLVIDPAKPAMNYDQDYVLVLDDWLDGLPGTPEDTMKQLIANGDRMGGMGGMGGNSANTPPPQTPPDVIYPLYLINGKPSESPMQLRVKQGDKVRLRFINPSGATTYRVALAGHRMTVTHTDGQPVEPVEVDVVRVGMGERYDVLINANNPGVWQLAAQAEGTPNIVRAVFSYEGSNATPPLPNYQPPELTRQLLLYSMLKAAPEVVVPPNSNPDQVVPVTLSGGMGQYVWTINGEVFSNSRPINIKGNRHIRFQFRNMSMMPHPMHLHGHFFQVDNGTGRGPMKDTVIVEPMQRLNIDWVSDNPGSWAFHCHNLYHMEAGMMRVVKVS